MIEIIDVARFKREGIGYVMMRESYVSKYIRKKVDENTLEFMLGEYIKACFRRSLSNLKGKYRNLKRKLQEIKEKIHGKILKLSTLKKSLYSWWLFWRL